MGEDEMKTIAHLIAEVVNEPDNKTVIDGVRARVKELCSEFPIYENYNPEAENSE